MVGTEVTEVTVVIVRVDTDGERWVMREVETERRVVVRRASLHPNCKCPRERECRHFTISFC